MCPNAKLSEMFFFSVSEKIPVDKGKIVFVKEDSRSGHVNCLHPVHNVDILLENNK